MGVLGAAIANHLVGLGGLYSVELPEALLADLVDLVITASATTPNRAVLVTDDNLSTPSFVTVRWREILRWRTTDDRVFAWKRGAREPDTSFRSAVRPFISSRFPGAGGGECTLEMLVRLSVVELWRRRRLKPVGDSFDAFCQTMQWVTGVLRHVFEKAGSMPSTHWSDRYLQHWSAMLDELDRGLDTLASPPAPRHAWEIVRVSGLPLPSAIVDGNPFAAAPRELEKKEWVGLADTWADIVSSFILRPGGMPLLLAALDRGTLGASQVNSWRGLSWQNIVSMPPDTPAPVVATRVFVSPDSPSMLSASTPLYPVAPVPSWWGVSSSNLVDAQRYLREETPLLPDPMGTGLVRLFASDPSPYILNTRSGTVTHAHTQKKWKARVTVGNICLRFKENWNVLHLSSMEPTLPQADDAWIDPDNVRVTCRGAREISLTPAITVGNQLAITGSLQVEYSTVIDARTGALSGTWNMSRSLKVELQVRRYLGGQWDTGRSVAEEIELLFPSPFSPSVIASTTGNKLVGVAPDNQDEFTANRQSPSPWISDATPTILLNEEGEYDLNIYDGTLSPVTPSFSGAPQPAVNNISFGQAANGVFTLARTQLDDGDLVTNADPTSSTDITVFNVKERSANVSSGLLSAVRGLPAGRKQPSATARASLLGQYQVGVTRALCTPEGTPPNSLFQYVISSTEIPVSWPSHSGRPEPHILLAAPPGFLLPGLGTGPTPALVQSTEWRRFMSIIETVRSLLGLRPGAEETWLSGVDLGVIPADLVRAYCDAHRDLVRASRQAAQTDIFWASHPFSVLVVEGRPGASFGQLLAVLLSPLHPARLAWGYAITRIARANTGDPALLGLLEGWNIPCAGIAFNPAGQRRQLVAVPIDPGTEQDFTAWGALAILGDSGLADLPVFAAGQQLPWGGRTGINARVVERALRDYFVVHPHLNSLELDVRSVSPAPRSQEIDEAILTLVGAGDADHIDELGGAIRVWDSDDRLGLPPTRDRLFSLRGETERDQPFEWRTYPAGSPPADADIAIVENASVHLAVVPGVAEGVLGLLPLRRFSPSLLNNLALDQHYLPPRGEDLLNLSDLLREIESLGDEVMPALRATPQLHALGIGQGARWEVLGSFNLDPTLLSALVSASSVSGTRLLWEWRPSWMSTERKQGDLARRPYFVVARIPASLLAALETRQAFSTQNASELLGTLGRHGVGLATLTAEGGTEESAAAGFFYAVRLLLPIASPGFTSRLASGGHLPILGVLPLDPAEPILQGLAGRKLDRRADMLAIAMRQEVPGELSICVVPIEVKHHGMPSRPEPIPLATDRELKRARQQLGQTARLMREIATTLASVPPVPAAATTYLKQLGLATLLDLAMSFVPGSVPVAKKTAILRSALSGRVSIGVGDAVLLWFAPGSMQSSGSACVVDRYGASSIESTRVREVFIDPHALPGLWWTGSQPGPNEIQAREQVDDVLVAAFSTCAATGGITSTPLGDVLSDALGLSSPNETAAPGTGETASTAPSPESAEQVTPDACAIATPSAPITQPIPSPPPSSVIAPPVSETTAVATTPLPQATPTPAPRAIVGWSEPAGRWTTVGKLANSEEMVALDLDHPKTVGVYGYMGSGKSYLLGNLVESAVKPIPGINSLPAPLAVVIFNYRRNASDRFELSSLALPNQKPADIERLEREYDAAPAAVDDMHILCLPGELRPDRQQEYGAIPATELFFDPRTLGAEDWELLMGEPGSEAVFARTIRNALVDLRSAGDITLELLEQHVEARLTGQSRTAARLRFDFVRRYLSPTRGTDFGQLLRAGRILVVDLRQPLFNKDDALRFFLVCANQISKVQGRFNKMIVFDEAHEYMSDAFGERMESRIRLMRHEGTSYVFASQDVRSIPLSISRFLTTRFVFDLGTRENVQDLEQAAPEFRGFQLLGMRPGHCFVHASKSPNDLFVRPREIRVRPRATQHGGASQIFSVNQ